MKQGPLDEPRYAKLTAEFTKDALAGRLDGDAPDLPDMPPLPQSGDETVALVYSEDGKRPADDDTPVE